jgi:hypothetical protein
MAVTQLIRIGWDRTIGHLVGGIDAWTSGGYETRSYPTASGVPKPAALVDLPKRHGQRRRQARSNPCRSA